MRLLLSACLLIVLGCESSGQKLQRLRAEKLQWCLLAESYDRTGDTTYQDAGIRCRLGQKKLEEYVASH